jgi:putative hydrolase of the HAD superfamily
MVGTPRPGPAWIFDLDNTLHDASPQVFPRINRGMTDYIMRHLDLSEEAAGQLRERYWRAYGATLLGLVRHHGVDPHHFLHHTHDVAELERLVAREAGLRHALARLPGRRVVFSNSPHRYALAVLAALGIADLFHAVYCIEHTGFRPKPDPAGFRAILRRERLVPSRTMMVEDVLENLVAARRLGMKTAWITREPRRPAWLDIRAVSVKELPRLAAAIGLTR